MKIENKIKHISLNIGSFISNWLLNKNGFGCRTFYGETYSLALLNELGLLDEKTKSTLLNIYEKQDKTDPEFHWEFNKYAFLQYYFKTQDESIYKNHLNNNNFKNPKCTNWTLLRCNTKLALNKNDNESLDEAKQRLEKFQLNSGLILDEKRVKSFQYHCFSAIMAAEIYEATQDEFFLKTFLKASKFIRNFILKNGEFNYIGRGQNQSFGYASMIYLLSLNYKYEKDLKILSDLNKVVEFLKSKQQDDGYIPLVVSTDKKVIPKEPDMLDKNHVGWYPYNNYFDYLSFLGFFLVKSFNVLKDLGMSEITEEKQSLNYKDESFIKISFENYEAVISKPGGYLTNDVPIPVIVSKNKRLTPCYGGEEFQKSLYSTKGIALPYCNKLNKSIRWKALTFFVFNTLWVVSPLGVMKRKFEFKKNSIKIKTNMFSPFKFDNLFLFFKNTQKINDKELQIENMKITSSTLFTQAENQLSADGELLLFETKANNNLIELGFMLESKT